MAHFGRCWLDAAGRRRPPNAVNRQQLKWRNPANAGHGALDQSAPTVPAKPLFAGSIPAGASVPQRLRFIAVQWVNTSLGEIGEKSGLSGPKARVTSVHFPLLAIKGN
jgi:hypothetical protein